MKTVDLIEALQTADKVFRKKFKKPMEIFDLDFDHEEGIKIEAVGEVFYEGECFTGSKRGTKPHAVLMISFAVEDEKIVDRSVELEET